MDITPPPDGRRPQRPTPTWPPTHASDPPHGGSRAATDALFGTLYHELRRLARREAPRAGWVTALSATTLLHETYLDIGRREALHFPTPGHFLAYAAKTMRGVVVDRMRARLAAKRGGGAHVTTFDTAHGETLAQPEALIDIDAALDDLAALEPLLAQVVELRFFGGLSMAEIAALHGSSERTVQRQWEKARLLLAQAMRP